MTPYRMKALDTLTITEKGQAQFPASWRKQAGLMHGGPAMSAFWMTGGKAC